MGVTFLAPAGTYTSPAKLTTKEISANGTYNASDDNANGYSAVTVNVEGGGGSSDFSTAEVTLNVPDDDAFRSAIFPLVYEANDMGEGSPAMVCCVAFGSLESGTNKVVLYKGGALVQLDRIGDFTVGGNIAPVNEGMYLITGDCSITMLE